MLIRGKIIDKKNAGKIIFVILKNNNNQFRLVINKNQNNYSFSQGDVIECYVVEQNSESKNFNFNGKTYEVKNLKIISRHIENLKFNPNVDAITKYSNLKLQTRKFLDSQNYIEIAAPILTNEEVGSKSLSFKTYHDKTKRELFLIKSMDPFLRSLSCSGMGKIYSLGNIYRNEHISAWRQPEFEMLSIYSNYYSKEQSIDLCLKLFNYIGFNYGDTIKYKEGVVNTNILEEGLTIISKIPNGINTNSKRSNDEIYCDEFKIKYKSKTIVHGVNEICDIDEYLDLLKKQGINIVKGDLEILRNCIASGAVPCYSVGISLQRIFALQNDLKLDDFNPFPFSRIKKIKR